MIADLTPKTSRRPSGRRDFFGISRSLRAQTARNLELNNAKTVKNIYGDPAKAHKNLRKQSTRRAQLPLSLK
jgi:hypothetical protein